MSSQLQLFTVPTQEPRIDRHALTWERATSIEVEGEILAIFQARSGDWLSFHEFRAVYEKHGISSCLGHVLGFMARKGMIVDKAIFFGAEKPGDPNYQGFKHVYSLPATETA